MYKSNKIALVIPAYNEEKLIRPTLEHVPALIDKVYVVDDASTDNMAEVVRECMKSDGRVELIQHESNLGPGAGIITGYKRSAADGYDITVVVGGDNQMPLDQVTNFLDPIIEGAADYTKGNRFMEWRKAIGSVPKVMPRMRLVGNMLISGLTKIASGYYKVVDAVDGYTAITREAIELVDWDGAWKGYGYPMEFLVRLNAYGLRVKDVPRRAIYLPDERQSQINLFKYTFKVSRILAKGFLWRLVTKYVFWDFHPLVMFYFLGMVVLPAGFLMGLWLLWLQATGVGVSGPRAILCALLITTGLQFLLFAMLFDMEESK